MNEYELGDIAIVTTRKGRKYVAKYVYATGIAYFFAPLLEGYEYDVNGLESVLRDPEVSIEIIGKAV